MLEFFLTDEQQITGFKDAGDDRVKNMIELGGGCLQIKKRGITERHFLMVITNSGSSSNMDCSWWRFFHDQFFLLPPFFYRILQSCKKRVI